jgi:hypothetical protein
MPSSDLPSCRLSLGRVAGVALVLAALLVSSQAAAQQSAQGFAVERFYPSAPGGGWLVMDDLSMHGELGGAAAVTTGYALQPLRVSDGVRHLSVVSDRAFVDVALAVTFERLRLYANFTNPLVLRGQSGTVGSYAFAGPAVDVGSAPDLVSDVRLGFDARLVGDAHGPFRLGAGAQLYVPNGNQADYDSDGSVRAMFRALFAGDLGHFSYAAQVGVHVRPLDETPTPGAPRGSELLFGVAAGPRLPIDRGGRWSVVVGPELFGESALRSPFASSGTGLEGLVTGRLERDDGEGTQIHVKLGTGGGLDPRFGAPEWRILAGVEVTAAPRSRRVGCVATLPSCTRP